MSHRSRKMKQISEARRAAARANGAKSHGPVTPEGKAKSALNAITHGLTASALVLTTESKEKYAALLASYLEKCNPDGPIENDLVEEMVAAKWQQRRVASMIAALLDVTMDRMEKEIRDEFENIDNAARTALAFDKQAGQSATLALLNRYATRHARDYHRALNQLRQIQFDRRDQNDPPSSPVEKSQNEPKPDVNPELSTTSEPEVTVPDLATETSHQPSPTDRQSELATHHSSWPPATAKQDHCISETGHKPLICQTP